MSTPLVRLASAADAGPIGALLHEFNTEFGDPTPGPDALAARIVELLAIDTSVLVGSLGRPDGRVDGLAVLRFRPAIWTAHLECYLAELYVVPAERGKGLGRAIMLAAMDHARDRGADYMDLGTDETDTAARALYESLGFDNHNGRPDGPTSYFYERDL
jgi:ribosomal protein S18 acetylase RimI-like enzyme